MFFFSLRRTFLAPAAVRLLGGIQYSLLESSGIDIEWTGGLLGLLLAGDGALRTLAGARVGRGPLTADRKALTVTATLVAADLDLAADVGLDLATEVTLDLEVGFDLVTELDQLFVAQLVHAEVRVDAGAL